MPPAHGDARLFSLDQVDVGPDAPGPHGEADEAGTLEEAHERPPAPPHLPPDEPPSQAATVRAETPADGAFPSRRPPTSCWRA